MGNSETPTQQSQPVFNNHPAERPVEQDFQIVVKGLPEATAQAVGEAVLEHVRQLEKGTPTLDLRRMRQIVLAADFGAELAALSPAGDSVRYTNEEYGVAHARVLLIPRESDCDIVLLINGVIGVALLPHDLLPGDAPHIPEAYELAAHLLHHELAHVHDYNTKLDTLPYLGVNPAWEGKDAYHGGLADACWQEFVAQFLSSSTASSSILSETVDELAKAIPRARQLVNNEILAYRTHGDLSRLIEVFLRHGKYLVVCATYVLGFMEGTGKELDQLAPNPDRVHLAYFEPTWTRMRSVLHDMLTTYPVAWHSLGVYDPLIGVMSDYCQEMGLVFSDVEGRGVYLDVPPRPGTIPTPWWQTGSP